MNMLDMMGMMGKIKDVQANIQKTKDSLVHLTHIAESGAGLVKVTVNGKRQIISLEVDNSLQQPSEYTTMKDLIIAASNKAIAEMDAIIATEMKKATEGILPNIPGLDLGNLL